MSPSRYQVRPVRQVCPGRYHPLSTLALALAALASLPALAASPTPTPTPAPARETAELEKRISEQLAKHKVPGASVVLTDAAGDRWLAGIGKADVAAGKPVTPDTLFRIGSVSKTFAALSVLKLQEEGRLSLDTTVRSLVPEVRFENRWEATDPVRVVHLLEHTTGWDDLHFKEYASSDPKPLTLAEGLAIGPESRTSRWRPGTRSAYCNSGPAVAAAVVEKVTGRRFEEYVAGTFFAPIGMPTADYFLSPRTEALLTKLYHSDGKTPHPYWHVAIRPAGSINASGREMGAFLRFFLNRGSADGKAILSPASIDRMERPMTRWGATKAGLQTGYGLHNYTTLDDQGFVWHGHNGGVEGGLSELAYLPEHHVGYFFSINGDRGEAFEEIGKQIRLFLEKELPRPVFAPPPPPSATDARFAGWYLPDSPRNESLAFLENVLGVHRIHFRDGKLVLSPVLGEERIFLPAGGGTYREEKKGAPALALVDTEEGLVAQGGSWTFRKTGAFRAIASIGLTAAFLLVVVAVLLFALVWIPRWLFRRMRGVPNLHLRLLPLLAVLSFLGACLAMALSDEDLIPRFGAPTPWSIAFVAGTWAFALFSAASFLALLAAKRQGMNRAAWLHAVVVSLLLAIGALYLAWWGVIGWRPWS